jgi:hypothetical protein
LEALYGPGGDWVTLLGRQQGFVSSELKQISPRCYWLVDRWRSHFAFERFRTGCQVEIDALRIAGIDGVKTEFPLGASYVEESRGEDEGDELVPS